MERERNRAAAAIVDAQSAREFFTWLVPQLDRIFDDAVVQAHVTEKLRAVSTKVRWEAGPLSEASNFFAVSPNMNIEIVPIAEQISRCAPAVPGWVFLPARPRKTWQRIVSFKGRDGKKRSFNLSDWRYWLTSFNDGEFFDINFVPGAAQIPKPELQRLGEFLAAAELGEGTFLSYVGKVNIVSREEGRFETSSVEHLQSQFVELLQKHPTH